MMTDFPLFIQRLFSTRFLFVSSGFAWRKREALRAGQKPKMIPVPCGKEEREQDRLGSDLRDKRRNETSRAKWFIPRAAR